MLNEKHIIRKAIVEVHLPKADGAFDAQNKALVYFKEKIIPIIEGVIARLSLPGEVIRIDKLELDFRHFNVEQPDESAARKFEQHAEEKLIKLISEERSTHFPGEVITDVKKISKDKAGFELFMHLLKTGGLPWWAKTEQPVLLEPLAQEVLRQHAAAIKSEIIAALSISAVRKRIAYKLSADTIEKIISVSAVSASALLDHVHAILNLVKGNASFLERIRPQLYEYALARAAIAEGTLPEFLSGFINGKNDFSLIENLYRESIAAVADENVKLVKEALAAADGHFEGKVRKLFTVKDVKLFFEGKKENDPAVKELENKKEKSAEEKRAEKKNKKAVKTKNPDDQQQLNKAAKKPDDASAEISAENKKAGTEGAQKNPEKAAAYDPAELLAQAALQNGESDYFIKNAGVIILVPYLPALFKELELTDDKTFVSEEARERAAYLLQYMATGTTEAEEHEMVLNKVLCGIGILQPFTLELSLSEKEKEECNGLLRAVAANWPALKGASGEAMRDAFFMRDGILEQQSNGWNLKIEKITIDILLDKLPWGISILQMPWSKEMIFVSW